MSVSWSSRPKRLQKKKISVPRLGSRHAGFSPDLHSCPAWYCPMPYRTQGLGISLGFRWKLPWCFLCRKFVVQNVGFHGCHRLTFGDFFGIWCFQGRPCCHLKLIEILKKRLCPHHHHHHTLCRTCPTSSNRQAATGEAYSTKPGMSYLWPRTISGRLKCCNYCEQRPSVGSPKNAGPPKGYTTPAKNQHTSTITWHHVRGFCWSSEVIEIRRHKLANWR